MHFARERGVPVGPGRGSAAGSLVAYVLEITDIDPLQYGLIFERFLNPERISPPDIDLDFCESRRGEVLEYVRRKYGERRVAQIITFNKLKARSVVRDVSRVIGLSYADGDRLAKMIPNELKITLEAAVEKNPELKRAVATEPATKQVFEYGKFLEGMSRGVGVHAAGVVIGDRDLTEYIPLCRDVNGKEVITQFPMDPLNELGLLKMDFLGLKNLTVIEETVQLIRQREPDFDLKSIRLDDRKAFDSVLDQLSDPEEFRRSTETIDAQPDAESFDLVQFKDGRHYGGHQKRDAHIPDDLAPDAVLAERRGVDAADDDAALPDCVFRRALEGGPRQL